jgi:hypothetical protein
MLGAQADRQPVPQIDHADQDGEIGNAFGVELLLQLRIDIVRGAGLGNQRQRFGPGQRGALAWRIERGRSTSCRPRRRSWPRER